MAIVFILDSNGICCARRNEFGSRYKQTTSNKSNNQDH